jgi:hypothetical protein
MRRATKHDIIHINLDQSYVIAMPKRNKVLSIGPISKTFARREVLKRAYPARGDSFKPYIAF